MECNPLLSFSIDWKLFGPFIDVLHVEIAVQTLKRGAKGNPIFRILCWNYTIVVKNTNIITHTTHYVHDEDFKRMRKKKAFERGRKQQLWTVNLSFRNWEARSTEDIQQVNSVGSKYGVQLVPKKLTSTETETPERILYTKTQIWLNQIKVLC